MESKNVDSEIWNENFEKIVDLLGHRLVNNMKASVLLIDLEAATLRLQRMYRGMTVTFAQEVEKIRRHLHHVEGTEGRPEQAAAELLEATKRSDEPGKWRILLDAAKKVDGEHSITLHLLENGDLSDPWLDNPEHQRLISLFKEPLYNLLNLKALLPVMIVRDLIRFEDAPKIRTILKRGQVAYAQEELIAAMQTYKTNWYRKFLTILYEDEHHRALAEHIDPDFCREISADTENQASLLPQEQEMHFLSGDGYQNDDQSTTTKSSRGEFENGHSYSVSAAGQYEETPQVMSLQQVQGLQSTGNGEMETPALKQTEATSGCGCCAQLLVKVASLESTVQMKVSSLESTVLALQSEIKQLLETVSKGSK